MDNATKFIKDMLIVAAMVFVVTLPFGGGQLLIGAFFGLLVGFLAALSNIKKYGGD